jgi:hypothetical protein
MKPVLALRENFRQKLEKIYKKALSRRIKEGVNYGRNLFGSVFNIFICILCKVHIGVSVDQT